MSHAQSSSSPAGSKAAMLGANPASGHQDPAAPTQTATPAPADKPGDAAGLPASLQQIGSQLLARFKGLTTIEKVLSGLVLVFVVRHFTRSR